MRASRNETEIAVGALVERTIQNCGNFSIELPLANVFDDTNTFLGSGGPVR